MGKLRELCVAGVVASMALGAAGQTFHIIEPDRPDNSLKATDVSADGRVVAGGSAGTGAFRWTAAEGRVDLTPSQSIANCVSSDGRAFAGGRYVWPDGRGQPLDVGRISGYFQYTGISALSGDGSVAVGYGWEPTFNVAQAFVWTREEGLRTLADPFSMAIDVSDDGRTIVGMTEWYGNAVYWRDGVVHVLQSAGPGRDTCVATGINRDGSIIAGISGHDVVIWRNGVLTDLGFMPLMDLRMGVSDDGGVIVATGLGDSGRVAMVWTPEWGFMRLSDYAAGFGVVLPQGFTLSSCGGVSADGRTFVGAGFIDGVQRGYVITVPGPSGLLALMTAGIATGRRRRPV